MNRIKIYKEDYMEYTAISNHFIDEYMNEANDAQIKIYLYLVRAMNANLATSISDIADRFNYTEKDVLRSLKYWQKKGILSLDFNEDGILSGIHIEPLNSNQPNNLVENINITTSTQNSLDTASPKAAPILSLVTKQIPDKPSFSSDDLRKFKEKEDTSQLLFIAESYLQRPLTVSEMKSILYFSDTLHFSDDLIDYLIQYCIERNKKDFKYIEAVALNWAQAGITTAKQAEKFAYKYDKTVYAIMNSLGKSNSPTSKEVEFIKRWTKEYGFTTDIILVACERTVLATDHHRFEYAESILNNWFKGNVHHKADIEKADEAFQKKKRTAKPTSNSNKFNQFEQNEYDYDALEKELLSF